MPGKLTDAPWSRSSFTNEAFVSLAATCKDSSSGFAAKSSRCFMLSKLPTLVAHCNGVLPGLSSTFGLACACRSRKIISGWDDSAAMINGLLPEPVVRKSGSAIAQISASRMKLLWGWVVPTSSFQQDCNCVLVLDREAKAMQKSPPRQSQVELPHKSGVRGPPAIEKILQQ